ncbi:MAG: hypothetical protein JWN83_2046 [Chitinophagaceae bacterium]|nr:hypothetical protein [Chitinophagaceae bacterium]
MKIIPLIFLIIFQLSHVFTYGQKDVDPKYLNERIPAEFDIYFKKDEDQKNFKKLREFLSDKQDLYESLKSAKEFLSSDKSYIIQFQSRVKILSDSIAKKKAGDTVRIDPKLTYGTTVSPQNNKRVVSFIVSDIQQVLSELKEKINDLQNDTMEVNRLNWNISQVKNDIYRTQSQIDSALAPEYKQQTFRITISICFSALIGVLLIVFFYIIYRRSDNSISKDLLSGNGLQFVTLFVLIIAVILFGILGILQSSELAAILSGISGYILGKGTQKDLATTISKSDGTPP